MIRPPGESTRLAVEQRDRHWLIVLAQELADAGISGEGWSASQASARQAPERSGAMRRPGADRQHVGRFEARRLAFVAQRAG